MMHFQNNNNNNNFNSYGRKSEEYLFGDGYDWNNFYFVACGCGDGRFFGIENKFGKNIDEYPHCLIQFW